MQNACYSRGIAAAILLALLTPLAEAREKVGVVFGGGGARGAAHIGVLRILERENIPIDYVTGTSMGAIIGSLYASGYTVDEIEEILNTMDWSSVFADEPPRVDLPMREKEIDTGDLIAREVGIGRDGVKLPPGIIGGEDMLLTLQRFLVQTQPVIDYDDLPIPFRCVATNVATTTAVVFGRGDLALTVRASMSIPGAISPVRYDGMLLVDGGVTNNVPANVAREIGADRLIVINVGSPLLNEDKLTSPFAMMDRLFAGLMDQNTARVLETLTPRDIVIQPNMPDVQTLSFDKVDEAVKAGELAATAKLAELRSFAVSPQEYEAHRQAQLRKPFPPVRVAYIDVDKSQSRTADLVADTLDPLVGKTVTVDQIGDQVWRAMGPGTYERIGYQIVERNGEYGLMVKPVDKAWGPTFLRLGLQFEDDFNGRSNYQLNAEVRMTGLNEKGAEWRNLLQLGTYGGITSEFYFPFGKHGAWFVAPLAQWLTVNQPLTIDDQEIAQYRVNTGTAALRFGRDIGDNFRGSAALLRTYDYESLLTGSPDLPGSGRTNTTGARVEALFDSLDSVQFPTKGARVLANYTWYFDWLGGNQNGDLARLAYDQAFSFGRNTFALGARASVSDDVVNSFSTDATLGGLMFLSGYGDRELIGNQMVFGRLIYYRAMSDESGIIKMPLYIGASAEAGNVWFDYDDISANDLIYAGSIFLGIPLPVGPLRFGFGHSSTGQNSVYLTFGSYVRTTF
jgi:NTE family protein